MTRVRTATHADAPAITEVLNWVIRDTLITFNTQEKPVQHILDLMEASTPYWVAELDGQVVGYASYAQFRSGPGYAHSAEHSIALLPAAHGQGLGRVLMTCIEDHARNAAIHTLVAGISAENPAGVPFHAALGFEHSGRIPQAGFKWGRWIDLIFMHKLLLPAPDAG